MKIYGGHDYYDIGLGQGFDSDIIFDRKEYEMLNCPLWHEDDFPSVRYPDEKYYHSLDNSPMFIGDHRITTVYFAGKIYTRLSLEIRYNGVYTNKSFWSLQSFVEFCNDQKILIGRHISNYGIVNKRIFDESYFDAREPKKEHFEWLMDNRIPIAVYHNSSKKWRQPKPWIINPNTKQTNLRSIDFQKVIDPYQAFQELSMFIGNFGNPGNQMIEITDPKILVAKHGFDKWSFRKHKEDNNG